MGCFCACRTCHDLYADPETHEKSCESVASGARRLFSQGGPNIHESELEQGHIPMAEEVTQQRTGEETRKTPPPLLYYSIDKVAPALNRIDAADITVLSFPTASVIRKAHRRPFEMTFRHAIRLLLRAYGKCRIAPDTPN